MKALLYIFHRTFINYLKSLKKKPQKAIGPIFMIIFIMLFFIPRRKASGASEPMDKMVFVIIFTLLTIIFLLYSIHKGTKELKTYFMMSDVNLVFTSPIKPQTVLLYGLVKQISMEIFVSSWFVYQVPNILSSFNAPVKNQILLILAFIIFQIVFSNCLKLLVFAICTKYKGLAEKIRWAVKIISILLLVIPGALVYINRNNLEGVENAVFGIYNSPLTSYIPVIGWMKEIASQSISHIRVSFIIYLLLLIGLSGILLYVTYGIELDYYEDVISMAEENDIIQKVKRGNTKQVGMEYTRKSGRIFVNPIRKVRLKLDGVYGAKTFFYKHVNEYFKRGIWFINFFSLLYMAISIVYALTPVKEIKFLLFVFGGLLVYSSLANKIQNEIDYHYIYMIPDRAEKKIFYSSISSIIKVCIDGLLIFVPSGIIMHSSPIDIVFCIITYISFGILCTFSGLFVYKIGNKIGLMSSPVLFSLFLLLFQTVMLVPNIIIVLAVTFSLSLLGSCSVYFGMLSFNIGASIVFIYSCRSIFDNMEQNSLY